MTEWLNDFIFQKIPGFWPTENPGIPLGPDCERPATEIQKYAEIEFRKYQWIRIQTEQMYHKESEGKINIKSSLK